MLLTRKKLAGVSVAVAVTVRPHCPDRPHHRPRTGQLVRLTRAHLTNAPSGTRARSARAAGPTTRSALSHTEIPSKRLSGSRRCMRLGSRSSPGYEPPLMRAGFWALVERSELPASSVRFTPR
jgi:hypothetical protein